MTKPKSKYKYSASDRRKYFRPESNMLASFELVLTFLFWGLWAYLIAPLLSLGLWFVGVYLFHDRMIAMGGYEAFARTLGQYSLVFLGMAICLGLWIFWNKWRYGNHNRRTQQPDDINNEQISEKASLNQVTVDILQGSRCITMHFDDEKLPVIEQTGLIENEKEAHS